MIPIPSSLQDISATWLTAVMRNTGVLAQEVVAAVHQRANSAFNSSIAHLALTYAGDPPLEAPKRLIVKLNSDHNGEEEVAFYTFVASLPKRLPMLVSCYAADYSKETGRSYCLLQDLSESHTSGASLDASAEIQFDGMIDALAQFHAYWWQHPYLGQHFAAVRWWYRDRDSYERHIERREREWATFISAVSDWFPAELRNLYEQVLVGLPSLWARYLAPRVMMRSNITLTNGDCYTTQFLLPNNPGVDSTYIIDFQAVSGNFGPYDLVYLIATWLTPAQRQAQQRETRWLRRYHNGLRGHGVGNYTWENFFRDYQLMVALMIFDPVWDATNGSHQEYWWPKLQCLTGAFEDLQCAVLFE
jgi:hypothetical protein